MPLFHSDPVGLPGLAAMAVGLVAFFLALMAARYRATRVAKVADASSKHASWIWIIVQGLGLAIAGYGRIDVSLDEVIFGTAREIDVDTAILCATCEGSCCAPGTSPITCDICRGTGQIQRTMRSLLGNVMTSSPCGTCRGYGTIIPNPCPTCAGQGRVRAKRTVTIDVPAGVDTGMRLHLAGEGEAGPAGGPNGDLYLEVKVKHDDTFSRNGDDLLATLEVQMTDAVLGMTVTLAALDGDVEIEVKPGTQSADVITVKERGVTRLRGGGRGDLKVGIQVVTPVRLNSKEQQLMKQFAQSRRPVPPEFSTFQQGIFAKLRDRFLG